SHHPLKYLINVVNSLYIFCGYQIGVYFDAPDRFFARFTWAEIAAPLVGFPLLVLAYWTGFRALRDRQRQPLAAFFLFNIAYVNAVSCLFEKSEGAVYRFQIDAMIWAFLAIAVELLLVRSARVVQGAVTAAPPVPSGDVRN